MIECVDENDYILIRMKRSFPITVLKAIIIRVYELFKDIYNDNYSLECFNLADVDFFECLILINLIKILINLENIESEFILENGILSFILLS